jgi:hypothetical protein
MHYLSTVVLISISTQNDSLPAYKNYRDGLDQNLPNSLALAWASHPLHLLTVIRCRVVSAGWLLR